MAVVPSSPGSERAQTMASAGDDLAQACAMSPMTRRRAPPASSSSCVASEAARPGSVPTRVPSTPTRAPLRWASGRFAAQAMAAAGSCRTHSLPMLPARIWPITGKSTSRFSGSVSHAAARCGSAAAKPDSKVEASSPFLMSIVLRLAKAASGFSRAQRVRSTRMSILASGSHSGVLFRNSSTTAAMSPVGTVSANSSKARMRPMESL